MQGHPNISTDPPNGGFVVVSGPSPATLASYHSSAVRYPSPRSRLSVCLEDATMRPSIGWQKLKWFSMKGILTYCGITGGAPSLAFCATEQGKKAVIIFALAPEKVSIAR